MTDDTPHFPIHHCKSGPATPFLLLDRPMMQDDGDGGYLEQRTCAQCAGTFYRETGRPRTGDVWLSTQGKTHKVVRLEGDLVALRSESGLILRLSPVLVENEWYRLSTPPPSRLSSPPTPSTLPAPTSPIKDDS